MEPNVSGAALMFLGSGCGPALTDEQRSFLMEVEPTRFYPLTCLLEMFEAAAKSENDLLYATGRRWGAALRDELTRRGVSTGREALALIDGMYQEHHQGDVGHFLAEDDGGAAVRIINTGPYPMRLVAGAYQVFASFGEENANVSCSEADRTLHISWLDGDQP